jgi:GntR family transcriptional repressor for pyruvate dehydrogenase complex
LKKIFQIFLDIRLAALAVCHMFDQLGFKTVRTGKISELIAQQIKEAILAGLLKPGQRLPSERELGQQFEAGRNSVREALKMLEVSGLCTISHGSGVFVADATSRSVTDSFTSMLRLQKMSLNDLTQARIVFEPGVARLACERMTDEYVQKLKANISQAKALMKKGQRVVSENIAFHALVAEATQNIAIILTMKSLFRVVRKASLEITSKSPGAFGGSPRALTCHARILRAFQDKDSQRAYDLMLEHVLEVQDALLRTLRQQDLDEGEVRRTIGVVRDI